ncbi:MAG: serine/threonine protein kinase [Phycisphaerales bacterium]
MEPRQPQDELTTISSPPSPLAELSPPGETAGDMVGPYRLQEPIGSGTYGVVWLAERSDPMVQKVAVKILKPERSTEDIIARFDRERQALALLEHPNIARIFDGGLTKSGRPFFAMEYVRGDPITRFCDKNMLSVTQRLSLFIEACDGVQHAHDLGILNRDIKPEHILVVPTSDPQLGHVKIIDFGLAKSLGGKLTDMRIRTLRHHEMGTPAYMSPEQAEMGATEVDRTTDVYSLGVVLFELIVGDLPMDLDQLRSRAAISSLAEAIRDTETRTLYERLADSKEETVSSIATRRNTHPHNLLSVAKGELSWIVAKAVRKEPLHRYASARLLAQDIRDHLKGRPIQAAKGRRWYTIQRSIRRNRPWLILSAVIVVTAGLIAYMNSPWVGLMAIPVERVVSTVSDSKFATWLIDMDLRPRRVIKLGSLGIGVLFGAYKIVEFVRRKS